MPDYFDVVDAETFVPLETSRAPAFVIGAARFGTTRLIDNLYVGPTVRRNAGRAHLSRRTGGIAAYKAAALTSTLVQRGAAVDVVMTAEAERFVGALTFSSLTARPVYASLWDAPERIPHIRLVREADVAVVVPATANVIAKLAHGIADDLLTTALLAARIPVVIAPAMNDAMYEHPATRANLATLRARGYESSSPSVGFLAEGESGVGRLAAEERIARSDRAGARARALAATVSASPSRPDRRAKRSIRCALSAMRRRERWGSRSRARRPCAAPT